MSICRFMLLYGKVQTTTDDCKMTFAVGIISLNYRVTEALNVVQE